MLNLTFINIFDALEDLKMCVMYFSISTAEGVCSLHYLGGAEPQSAVRVHSYYQV